MDSDASRHAWPGASIDPSHKIQRNEESQLEQRKKLLLCYGIFEIGLGIFCCTAGGVVVKYLQSVYYSRAGPYWQGVLSLCGGASMIVGGVVGLVTYFKPTRCFYFVNLVTSILNVLLLLPLIVLSSFAAYTSYYDSVFICYVLIMICSTLGQIITVVHCTCSGVGLSCCVSDTRVYTQVPLHQISVDQGGQGGGDPAQVSGSETLLT